MINILFKDKLEEIMSNVVLKTIVGIPSLLCFAIVTMVYHLKKGEFKRGKN
ncbi:hypothetical protein [Clostridium sp. 3-3]|jgi:hypothetical protein|nr:hypothetical protein [Clostridium sp. 3-3]